MLCFSVGFAAPTVQFEQLLYYVDESDGIVHVPVLRTGDLTFETSVICYTRQQTAQVMMDYTERPWNDHSMINFLPGKKVKLFYFNNITRFTWVMSRYLFWG